MTDIYTDAEEVKELTYTNGFGQFQVGSHHSKNTNIGVPLREEDRKMFQNTTFDSNSAMSEDIREAEEGIKRKIAQQTIVRSKINECKAKFQKLKKLKDKISQRGKDSLTDSETEFLNKNPVQDLNKKLTGYRKEADDLRSAVTKLREEAQKIKKHMEITFKVKIFFLFKSLLIKFLLFKIT